MNLIDAARNGDIKTINKLLDEGADPNKLSEDGRLPLAVAVRNSNTTSSLETVKLLLDRGADPDLKEIGNNGFTALIIASRYSNTDSSLETVKLLLERKAKVDLRNNTGNTALIVAAGNSAKDSSVETVKLLLENDANVNLVNNTDYSALRAAANFSDTRSSFETVKLLLEYGANPFVTIECPTVECEKLIASYRWKRLRVRDLDTAKRYSVNAEIKLPKEVWGIILMNKRQQQLCKNLNNNQNIELLILFAEELGIPIQENMTKGKLCGLISRQLAYGKEEKYRGYAERDLQKYKKYILILARKLGIDTNQSAENILKALSKIM